MDEVEVANEDLKIGDKVRVVVGDYNTGDFPPGDDLGVHAVIRVMEDGKVDVIPEGGGPEWFACPRDWMHKLRDNVNHPAHYNTHGVEVIDIIESRYADNYHLANAVKYLLRAPYKGAMIEDIQKCRWYIDRWLERQA